MANEALPALTRSVNGKLLRCGYTTGACAAAAAKAAGLALLTGASVARVTIATPKGIPLTLEVLDLCLGQGRAGCAVRKHSGDDPDVTDGVLVHAQVELRPQGVAIEGGAGVGRVTLPGLDQPPGAPAINSGPRAMIARELAAVAEQAGYPGGFFVEISIPGGAELAARTFNPRLGIQGGLSILGTTGILEPMSTQAQADTLRAQLAQLAAAGAREALLTPGRYGEAFARDRLGLCMDSHIPCGNHIGDALDAGAELGFTHLLLVGHIGKLVKLGIGITNTHSAQGDGRMETLLACALEAGAALPLLRGVAGSVTADGALALLWQGGLLEKTMALLGRRIQGCLERRLPAGTTGGFLCFTNAPAFAGVLTQSGNAENLLERWRQRP